MDQALASLITSAAGTGATANPNSRYYGAQIESTTLADETPVNYLARRIIPQPDTYSSTQSYVIVEGDRLDNLAAKFLGAEYTTVNEAGESTALRATEVSPQETLPFPAVATDAPMCAECGGLMTRNGSCYKCENCGGTSGCS